MKASLLFCITLSFIASVLHATDESYDSGFEPTPPTPFPSDYKDYQILPGSISPNQQYALIYPKRSRLFELPGYGGLYLVNLKPFQILTEIQLEYSSLTASGRCSYGVNWTKDSSAVIAIEGIKWGPDKVYLIPIQNGKAGKITDLTAQVRKQVQPDYKKSHASRYNEYFDFIFDADDGDSWSFDDKGQVTIYCACTNDPKPGNPSAWEVKFSGLWDITKGRFIEKTIKRIPRKAMDE